MNSLCIICKKEFQKTGNRKLCCSKKCSKINHDNITIKWQKDHPEKNREVNKKWRKNNPEKCRESNKKYYENNKKNTIDVTEEQAKILISGNFLLVEKSMNGLCKICKEEFKKTHGNEKFCSKNCRNINRNKLSNEYYYDKNPIKPIKCLICKLEFTPTHGNQKCCSENCSKVNNDKQSLKNYHIRRIKNIWENTRNGIALNSSNLTKKYNDILNSNDKSNGYRYRIKRKLISRNNQERYFQKVRDGEIDE